MSGNALKSDSQQAIRDLEERENASIPDAEVSPAAADAEADAESPTGNGKGVGCYGGGGWWRCLVPAKANESDEAASPDDENHVKATLRELVIYCCFLVLMTVVAFGTKNISMYNFTQSISGLFLKVPISNGTKLFAEINSIQEWWSFVNRPLLDGLFSSSGNLSAANATARSTIYYETVLLGVAQIRQVRVGNRTCKVAKPFRGVIGWCHGPYSADNAHRGAFQGRGGGSGMAWVYQNEAHLDGSGSYSGAVATYEGGGYRALLQPTWAASEQTLRNLFDSLWLDRSTRAVFIDFTMYNPNVNLFCVARLVAELPATGGVVPSWEFRSLKLLRYVEPFDYFVAACECGLLLMCIYYTVLEVLEIRRQRMAYLKVLSNYLDVALLIVCYVCAGFNIYRIAAVSNKLHQLLVDSLDCPNFYSLSYWQTCFNHAVAIAVFLAWIKVFKYVRFSRTLTMLSATLGSCAKDLVAFCIIFFIIFFAFALLGTLVFGTQVDDFQNFQQAVFTLFRIILGDVNFYKIQQANRLIGPVYFLLYVFFVFFILLNMFLAIINEKFGEVKADNEFGGGHARIDVARFLRRRADRLMDKLAVRRQKVLDIQRAVLQCGDEATVNFEGWRNQLRQRGFADAEIEALFAKYDADGDQVLSAAERMQMRRDLEGEKMKLDREITGAAPAPDQVETSFEVGSDAACSVLDEDAGAPGLRSGFRGEPASRDELAFLTRRVDRLEGRVGGALNSIDRVLMTLERLERLRLEHRTSLYRMLKLVRAPLSGSPEVSRLNLMEQLQQELRQWDSPAAGVGKPEQQ
ncbi:hypothetical protein BOX15_Mlig030870g5 [Macrostomum lignano]|uniref:EF-hand domain-containing protein n=1 Tax=Macrostomum lignano TaxID=282301 RepID=A0A267EGI7_9PLAT|nr:hypothetical protein BOX15_Mlig030870g5 [Macrostomum lignano]